MKKLSLVVVICSLFFTQLSFGDTKSSYIAEAGIQGYAKDIEDYYPHDIGYFIGGGYGLIFREKFALSVETRGVYMPYNGDPEYIGPMPTVWPLVTLIEKKSEPSYAVDFDLTLRISDYRQLSMLQSDKGFYFKTGFGISCVRRGELRKRYLRSDNSTYEKVNESEWGIPARFFILGIGFEYRISDDLAIHCEFRPKWRTNKLNPLLVTFPLGVGVRF